MVALVSARLRGARGGRESPSPPTRVVAVNRRGSGRPRMHAFRGRRFIGAGLSVTAPVAKRDGAQAKRDGALV